MAPVTPAPSRRPAVTFAQGVVVVVVALAFGAAGALYTFLTPPTYDASTLIQIDPTEISTTQETSEVTAQEVATQSLVVDSAPVTQAVIDLLGLSTSVQDLQKMVTVEAVNDSRVLRVTAAWDSPDGAVTVADAFASEYLQYRDEERDARLAAIGSTGTPGDALAPAPGGQVLTPATTDGAPAGLPAAVTIALSALLGALVGIVLVYAGLVRWPRRPQPTRLAKRTDTVSVDQ